MLRARWQIALPWLGVRLIDGGGIASARVRETFHEPPVWRSERGVLRRNLEMRRAATKLGHRKILTLTYAGAIRYRPDVFNPAIASRCD
jgi:hypothetical protein